MRLSLLVVLVLLLLGSCKPRLTAPEEPRPETAPQTEPTPLEPAPLPEENPETLDVMPDSGVTPVPLQPVEPDSQGLKAQRGQGTEEPPETPLVASPFSRAAVEAMAAELAGLPADTQGLLRSRLAFDLSQRMWWRGDYQPSLDTLDAALAETPKNEAESRKALLLQRAQTLDSLARVGEARKQYRELLELEPEGPVAFAALVGLARMALDEESPLEAQKHVDAARPMLGTLPEGPSLVRAEFLALQAREAALEMDFANASILLSEAQGPIEEKWGANHPYLIDLLLTTGAIQMVLGDVEASADAYGRAMNIVESTFGPDHPTLGEVYSHLGLISSSIGDNQEAERFYEKAISIVEARLGTGHPLLSTPLNNLGELYRQEEVYDRADELLSRALAIDESVWGQQSPRLIPSITNLALLRENQNRPEDARALYGRALAIATATFGPEHPSTAASMNNQAAFFLSHNELDKAEDTFRKAVGILERTAGPDHVSTATTRLGLAQVLYAREKMEEAEALFLASIKTLEETFGPTHPYVAMALAALAQLYADTQQEEKAEEIMLRVLSIMDVSPEVISSETDTEAPETAPDQ